MALDHEPRHFGHLRHLHGAGQQAVVGRGAACLFAHHNPPVSARGAALDVYFGYLLPHRSASLGEVPDAALHCGSARVQRRCG